MIPGSVVSRHLPFGSGARKLQFQTAPAGMNGSVMPRLFVAPMELAIWEVFGNTAAIR